MAAALHAWMVAAVALLLALPASAQDREAPGDGIDVTRYALALTPDIANRSVAGREVIKLRATRGDIRRLRFSANALRIDSAELDGVPVVHGSGPDGIDIALPRPLALGRTATLTLAYHGRPARGLVGSATTLYTSYFACDWMICAQDRFGDKADFTLDLRVPAGFETLSAGRRQRVIRGADGSMVHRWRSPRPYPAYLYGFAVGRFVRVRNGPFVYASGVADGAELNRRFADTPAIAAFFADKAGLPLPAPPYTQLLVPGDEAQEAATYSVLGLEAVPETPGDPDRDWAVAHELAHQWWGNLVTCASLRDFWLNEGIATFMTAAWKEHRHGLAAYRAELETARQRLERARAAGFDRPLAWAGRYPDLRTRRAIQYSKGALFLAHLRMLLGDAPFWAGLRRYTRVHAGGAVTSIDLQQAMEAASGRDLAPVFAEWVFGAATGPDTERSP